MISVKVMETVLLVEETPMISISRYRNIYMLLYFINHVNFLDEQLIMLIGYLIPTFLVVISISDLDMCSCTSSVSLDLSHCGAKLTWAQTSLYNRLFLLDTFSALEDCGFAGKLRFSTFSHEFWQNYWGFLKFSSIFEQILLI